MLSKYLFWIDESFSVKIFLKYKLLRSTTPIMYNIHIYLISFSRYICTLQNGTRWTKFAQIPKFKLFYKRIVEILAVKICVFSALYNPKGHPALWSFRNGITYTHGTSTKDLRLWVLTFNMPSKPLLCSNFMFQTCVRCLYVFNKTLETITNLNQL